MCILIIAIYRDPQNERIYHVILHCYLSYKILYLIVDRKVIDYICFNLKIMWNTFKYKLRFC